MTGVTDEAEVQAIEATVLPPWTADDRTIHQRMVAILDELPAIGKTAENKQQNFMYRSHDEVLNALNPLLAKHRVYVMPEVLERIPSERTTGQGKTMYEINLRVRYTFIGAMGDCVSAVVWGEGTDMGDKTTSKAMTMAFKTVLAQSFAVSTEEGFDPDSATTEETTRGGGSQARSGQQARPQAAPQLASSWKAWTDLMADNGVPGIDSAEWLRQARESAGIDQETQAGKDDLFKRANVALAVLVAHEGELQFVVGARAIVADAFKQGFAQEIEGPIWRLDPEETGRQTYHEYQKALEALGE